MNQIVSSLLAFLSILSMVVGTIVVAIRSCFVKQFEDSAYTALSQQETDFLANEHEEEDDFSLVEIVIHSTPILPAAVVHVEQVQVVQEEGAIEIVIHSPSMAAAEPATTTGFEFPSLLATFEVAPISADASDLSVIVTSPAVVQEQDQDTFQAPQEQDDQAQGTSTAATAAPISATVAQEQNDQAHATTGAPISATVVELLSVDEPAQEHHREAQVTSTGATAEPTVAELTAIIRAAMRLGDSRQQAFAPASTGSTRRSLSTLPERVVKQVRFADANEEVLFDRDAPSLHPPIERKHPEMKPAARAFPPAIVITPRGITRRLVSPIPDRPAARPREIEITPTTPRLPPQTQATRKRNPRQAQKPVWR
jgi:hypothetical protein